MNLGTAYSDLGDAVKAKELYERALAIEEAAYGPAHVNVARTLGSLVRGNSLHSAPSTWVPLMQAAWGQDPDRRPEFSLLQQRLRALSEVNSGDWGQRYTAAKSATEEERYDLNVVSLWQAPKTRFSMNICIDST